MIRLAVFCAMFVTANITHADGAIESTYGDVLLFDAVDWPPGAFTLHTQQGKAGRVIGSSVIGRPGRLVGGGGGLRLVVGFRHGVRLAFEGGATDGTVIDGDYAFPVTDAWQFSVAASLGWQGVKGPAILHTATVVGWDALSVDLDAPTTSGSVASRDRLRFGQQVGVRLQIFRFVAVFAEAELDYDRAWRVAVGLGVGRHDRVTTVAAPGP
jgi:hypothetical protein